MHAWVPCSTGLATLASAKQARANPHGTVFSQGWNNHAPFPWYAHHASFTPWTTTDSLSVWTVHDSTCWLLRLKHDVTAVSLCHCQCYSQTDWSSARLWFGNETGCYSAWVVAKMQVVVSYYSMLVTPNHHWLPWADLWLWTTLHAIWFLMHRHLQLVLQTPWPLLLGVSYLPSPSTFSPPLLSGSLSGISLNL